MVAAPFKITMVARSARGGSKVYYLTASDVANEYALFPSGDSSVVLNDVPVWITDVALSAAGSDTSRLEFFINGVSTGLIILNAASLVTAVTRTIQQAPIYVPAGAQIKIKQLA